MILEKEGGEGGKKGKGRQEEGRLKWEGKEEMGEGRVKWGREEGEEGKVE